MFWSERDPERFRQVARAATKRSLLDPPTGAGAACRHQRGAIERLNARSERGVALPFAL